MPLLKRSLMLMLVGLFATLSSVAHAIEAPLVWSMLDYMAVDYGIAVADGEIIDAMEYEEMQEFAATVIQGLEGLPPNEHSEELKAGAAALQEAVEARDSVEKVAGMARALAALLLEAHPMPLAPDEAPDMDTAAALYAQHCASCHGVDGAGDGPLAEGMDPPPIAFTDQQRADERSVFSLYQVTTLGLEDTDMESFEHLPEHARWALAFYVGSLAYPKGEVSRGKKIWAENDAAHHALPNLQTLVAILPADLRNDVGAESAVALTAYLRRHPHAAVPTSHGSLQFTRVQLEASKAAYLEGRTKEAASLALSAYLDGFEPVEPVLATKDRALMILIETQMAELRHLIGSNAPAEELIAQIERLEASFSKAEAALDDTETEAVQAFLGAFTILLREGLEALLVVIAMVALLKKAGRFELMPYVHAGWLGALGAGVVTWFAATYLISISGASRELTEGYASILAAAVLVFVGLWMHGKSGAGAWQRYINEKLNIALSKRSAWFLLLLVFVVVYREVFETILFYTALWSQGQRGAIVSGAGAATVVLALAAWLMLRVSRKLPISQFFAFSSVLIAVLAVVLTGKGIAALQEAGAVATTVLNTPRVAWLGVYPTLQGVGAQLLVLGLLIAGYLWNRRTMAKDALLEG